MSEQSSSSTSRPPSTGEGEVIKVLLIEDEESYAGLVSLLLAANPEQECVTTVAGTLAAGLELLGKTPDFEAVLLDLTLPDSAGLDTLLRLIHAFPNISVIVLTGTSDPLLGGRAVEAGAQDYLVKGEFEPPQLYRVLRFSMERKRILLRLEEAQRIAKIGSWEFRPEDDFFFAGEEIYRMLGLDPTQRIFTYGGVVASTGPLSLLREHEKTPDRPKLQRGVSRTRPDGSLVHLLLNSRREVRKSGGVHYIGTLQDVTLQKKTEALERAQALSEETARVREQVIATVSHELRTPMNAIVGMSNLLVETPLDAEQKDYMGALQDASQLLLSIINDILLASSLQNNVLELSEEPFDLSLTIRRIIEALQPKAEAKGLRLTYELNPPLRHQIFADKQRLSQILYNVVGNAVKFTESGNVELLVRWRTVAPNQLALTFNVKDTGPGIPEQEQSRIFQAFSRLRTAGVRREGIGLGLAITKQLAERMGGSIGLESTPGRGSVFTIELPAVLARKATWQPFTKPERMLSELGPNRILLVEDHAMNQIVLRKTLERKWPEARLTVATTGREARNELANNDFDLIFMDIQLPDEDGYELTRYLRTELKERHGSTPVLAMTAQTRITEDENYLQAGMNDYLLKPFNPRELYEKITQHLK